MKVWNRMMAWANLVVIAFVVMGLISQPDWPTLQFSLYYFGASTTTLSVGSLLFAGDRSAFSPDMTKFLACLAVVANLITAGISILGVARVEESDLRLAGLALLAIQLLNLAYIARERHRIWPKEPIGAEGQPDSPTADSDRE